MAMDIQTYTGVVNVKDYGAVGDGVTDDAAAIQAALDVGGYVVVPKSSTPYMISSGLVIKSNTTFEIMKGAIVKAKTGNGFTLLKNESFVSTPKNVTSITSSGRNLTFTCVGHGYAVGDWVSSQWARPEFFSGVFRIKTVPTVDTFTVSAYGIPTSSSASATPTKTMSVRAADVNIKIKVFGLLDYNGNTGTSGENHMGTILAHVYNLDFEGNWKGAYKYNILVGAAKKVSYRNIYCEGTSDGLHFIGPIHDANGVNLSGQNGDNLLAIGTSDYASYRISEGNISAVHFVNTTAINSSVDVVRFFGDSNFGISGIVDGVHGTIAATGFSSVRFLQDNLVGDDGDVHIRDVEIKNITCQAENNQGVVDIGAHTIDKLKISNVEQNTTSVGNFLINLNNGNVKHLILEGNVFSADVADSKLINIYNTVVSIGTISLIGNTTKSTWGINNNSTQSFTVLASGNRFDCSSHVIRQAGTSGTVKYIGSSNDYVANTNIARPISAGLLAVYDWGAPVDIQYLGNSDGQHCYNTNSGQAGGVGLVMANGTSWAKI